jgi:hypothetical protein
MASVINIDVSQFTEGMGDVWALLNRTELWLRPVVAELSGEMSQRIHKEGRASNGGQIGLYSNEYLKRRMENKLGSSQQVVLVYTRKTSNSWGAFATEKGWGVGFADEGSAGNPGSYDKIKFNEKRFKVDIMNPTAEELAMVNQRVNEILTQLFSQL